MSGRREDTEAHPLHPETPQLLQSRPAPWPSHLYSRSLERGPTLGRRRASCPHALAWCETRAQAFLQFFLKRMG